MNADEPAEHPSLEELFGPEPDPAPADVAPPRSEPDRAAGAPLSIDDLFAAAVQEEAVAAAADPDDDEPDDDEPDDDEPETEPDDEPDDDEPEPDAAVPDREASDELDDDPPDESDAADVDDDEDLIALADEAVTRFVDESAVADEQARAAATEAAATAAASAVKARARDERAVAAPAPSADPAAEAADSDGLVLQFPSPDFPPPPVLRIRVPDGWLAVPVPEAEMAVRHPETFDGFHPNVLVRVRRAAASATIRDDLRRVAGLEDAPDGMEVLSDDVQTDIATPARRLLVRFAGPGGVVLRARHLLVYVAATDHVANIVSVAGTWPEAAGDAVAAEVDAAVGSLRLFMPRPTS